MGSELAWRNRRVIAGRLRWPRGVLEECERLDGVHPGWSVWWWPASTITGRSCPAGYAATRPEVPMLRDADGRRLPARVSAPTVAELEERIAVVESQIAAAEECNARVWTSIRNGWIRV